VAALADAVAGLSVDPARMRANLGSTRGVIFAERAVMLLTPHVGRDVAKALVAEAVRACAEPGVTFGQALERIPAVSAVLSPAVLREIDRPENYIGQADALRSASLAGPAGDEKE
jgi:3-carboxy-cis,cis-muconate cycloisomerase